MSFQRFVSNNKGKSKAYPGYAEHLFNFVRDLKALDLGDMSPPLDMSNNGMTDPRFAKLVHFFNDGNTEQAHGPNNPVNNRHVSSVLGSLYTFTPIEYIASDEEIQQDFKRIKELVIEDSLYISDESFQFQHQITMYNPYLDNSFDFGTLLFVFDNKNVIVHKVKNNTIRNDTLHPYVGRDGLLCLGDFKKPYQIAMKQFRFFDAFDFVMRVMERYGGDQENGQTSGPHNPFLLWGGIKCKECGCNMKVDDAIPCSVSNETMCQGCAKHNQDEYTGKYYRCTYLKKCDTCKKQTIEVTRYKDTDHTWCLQCRIGGMIPEIPEQKQEENPVNELLDKVLEENDYEQGEEPQTKTEEAVETTTAESESGESKPTESTETQEEVDETTEESSETEDSDTGNTESEESEEEQEESDGASESDEASETDEE